MTKRRDYRNKSAVVLSERDLDVLEALAARCDDEDRQGRVLARFSTQDCGGTNGSYHSYVLHKLAKKGLVDHQNLRGNRREKGSASWRINKVGVAYLSTLGFYKRRAEARAFNKRKFG